MIFYAKKSPNSSFWRRPESRKRPVSLDSGIRRSDGEGPVIARSEATKQSYNSSDIRRSKLRRSARNDKFAVSRRALQAGFTLIETIIVIVLVGAMMAGMTSLFVTNVGNSHRPYLRQKALAVANAFMDEILRKRWNEATPLGGGCVNTGSGACPAGPAAIAIGADGESRATYDDIDDYNGLNQSPPQDSSPAVMPGYTGYTVNVTVTQPAAAWNGVPAADVRLITVSVTSSSNETIAVSAYRVNF